MAGLGFYSWLAGPAIVCCGTDLAEFLPTRSLIEAYR